jgi:hypothetical protein
MTVDVAGGMVLVDGTEATYQGLYLCENRGAATVVLDAADATNPRIDLVVAKVRDSAYSGASNDWQLTFKKGTAAGTPAEPTPDANSFVLAKVTVRSIAAGGGTVLTSDIEDRRIQSGKGLATPGGGTIVTTSTQRPTTGLSEGTTLLETDTNRRYTYSGSAWVATGAYDTILPVYYQAVLAGGASLTNATWASVPSVMTAPYALRMEVEISGYIANTTGYNAVALMVQDEAGTAITKGFTANEVVYDTDTRRTPFHVIGAKDVASGATCGFQSQYRSGGGAWNINALCRVSFLPMVA